MKIAFFEIHEWEKEILKKRLKNHNLLFYSTPLTKGHLNDIKECEVISVFIYSKIDCSILEKLPNLKLVVTRSTGYNHIDCRYCYKNKIKICNIPYYGENTVAEHTFALILGLSRKIYKSYLKTMANDFSISGLDGFDLKGKTLGVVGTGHIGKHVLRIAKGFEMKTLGFDRHQDSKLAKKLGFRYSSLRNLLKNSDIVSLHLPLTKETNHIINKSSIKLMKPKALIINTARGELIDTEALLEALNKNKLSGAGLDVIEGEELIKEEKELLHKKDGKTLRKIALDFNLIRNEKVIFTPHIAFYSNEALNRILETTIENIKEFAKGKTINEVKNV